jgi:hypothetical protein
MLPVGAELKFHRNASYHTHGQIKGKNPSPEAGCVVERIIFRKESKRFENDDQQG